MKKIFLLLILSIILFVPSYVFSQIQSDPLEQQASLDIQNKPEEPEPKSAVADGEYVIGPKDVLDITVWNEPNLSKRYRVTSNGLILIPLIKEIRAAGLTPVELADKIVLHLKEGGFLVDPKVSVTVVEYNSQKVLLFGNANEPGLYRLRGKTTVLEFLSQAGGVNLEKANQLVITRVPGVYKDGIVDFNKVKGLDEEGEQIVIIADLYSLLFEGDLSQNIEIIPGDVIYVTSGSENKVYIMGEVAKPGPYELPEKDMTVFEAINLAGGFTEYAWSSRIKVIRKEGEEKKTIKVSLKSMKKGDKSQDIILQPGDVVVVPTSWF